MRNKDTGEFELVIGDKQLLSGFFIGIVLLAVVFVMGYMMGRGTHSSTPTQSETAGVTPSAQPDSPAPQTAAPSATAATPAASTPAASTPVDTPAAEAPPQPTTVPARDSAAAPAPAPAADPANASYWQVTATSSRNSADAVSQTLQNKGFPASTRPGPNNLTLVWVGPYTDKESLRKAKQKLEEAGFNTTKKP